MNYSNGYEQYINTQIFAAGYPNVIQYKNNKHFSSGEIKGIDLENGSFDHNCDTRGGSSGSPLLNISQNVIGIHYGCDKNRTTNYGTFIGFVIEKLKTEEEQINLVDEKEESDSNELVSFNSTTNFGQNHPEQKGKIIAINIISIDQKISYCLPCKSTDIFVDIEKQLYKEYPEYKYTNNYFTIQGRLIQRFLSLEENRIGNSSLILLNNYED